MEGFSIYKSTIEAKGKNAVLVLEDGTVFRGFGFGASKKTSGEVVFNTGMVGYTEAITDPSYKGQILLQTYPLIGNYGVSSSSYESDGPKIEGYIIRELCREPNHWTSEFSLDNWLLNTGIPGIEGVDTRMITKKIRNLGTMLGILQVFETLNDDSITQLKEEIKDIIHPDKKKLVYSVATDHIEKFDAGSRRGIVLVDCGVKFSIIKNILERRFNVFLTPPQTSASDILAMNPVAVVFSNGPGDPKMLEDVIETARELTETQIPMLGICLGCQILALSLGANTYKLKFGHRGQNHPCIDLTTGRCYITSQNHGFTVSQDSLKKQNLQLRLINANDKTVEGFECKKRLIQGFQFHPEASPGPNDTNFLFDAFFGRIASSYLGDNYA